MSRRSQSTSALPVETFRDSNQVLHGVNRFAELHRRCCRVALWDVSYNRGPWKPFSIQFASWK